MASEEPLKPGKDTGFVKSRLKRLARGESAWEADFRMLPKPPTQNVTEYLGMVVKATDGALLADLPIRGRPSVNDLATLLARAMTRPAEGKGRRPGLVRLRGHHQWRGLFPSLEEVGIAVSVERELPAIGSAFGDYLRRQREAHKVGMSRPSASQAKVEAMFPAIAKYVGGYGYIEIGDQEEFGFVVRAIGDGGLAFEDDRPDTLAEAMSILEAGLMNWFAEQGIEFP